MRPGDEEQGAVPHRGGCELMQAWMTVARLHPAVHSG